MQTRLIPSSGAALPVIGCGTWRGFDVGSQPSQLQQRAQVLSALFDCGGRVADSSPMYGSAEQMERSMALLRTRHIDLIPNWNRQARRTGVLTSGLPKGRGLMRNAPGLPSARG